MIYYGKRKKSLYDNLVWALLIWCVLQDFVLAAMLKITRVTAFVNILFYSKDIMLIVLFVAALFRKKFPKNMAASYIVYFALVGIQTGVTLASRGGQLSITSVLSSVRGLILLPVLTFVGFSVRNKGLFLEKTKKYYRFLMVIAIIGIIEFIADILFGTKSFWMDTLGLNDFYTVIKGQPALIENGTPGNWYTDIGRGYRTQKRLISIWAAPLTAGFVLLLPALYYVMKLFKKKKMFSRAMKINQSNHLFTVIICSVALLLTFTRQTILPYIMLCVASYLYYNKKNRKVLFICIGLLALIAGIGLSSQIISYLNNGSTRVHIIQIQNGLSHLNFLGSGVGTFGTRLTGAIGTESQYITLVGQLGVLALPIYLIIMLYPVFYCRRKANTIEKDTRVMIVSVCFAGLTYALAGIVSETVAAFTSIAQYFVLIGVCWGYCKDRKKEIITIGN